MDQLAPSQTSTTLGAAIAAQADAEVHDTLVRISFPARPIGAGSIIQVLPSQCSARVVQQLPKISPTAVQSVADVHDTALNW